MSFPLYQQVNREILYILIFILKNQTELIFNCKNGAQLDLEIYVTFNKKKIFTFDLILCIHRFDKEKKWQVIL